MKTSHWFWSYFVLAACHASPQSPFPMGDSFASAESLGKVDAKIEEASGLVASANNKGMFWTLNDSGHPAELYLIDQKAKTRMVCRLADTKNRDWEDIALAEDPASGINYLYVADIGDNMSQHKTKLIYRLQEPTLGDSKKVIIEHFDTLEIVLPDGVRDTETLMIDPIHHNMLLVSKWEDSVHVYTINFPYPRKSFAALQLKLPMHKIVAGDISVDGTEVLLKDYAHVYYWQREGEEEITSTLSRPPVRLQYQREPQGEAIAFARDGSGYYTLSESTKKHKAELLFYSRR
jgi:hypothetical protein